MLFIEVEREIKNCLNYKTTDKLKAQQNKQKFVNYVYMLKKEFKTEITTEYLKNMLVGKNKQKLNRINYLLKEVGINTDRENKYSVKKSVFVVSIPIVEYRKVKTNGNFYKTVGSEIKDRLIKSTRNIQVVKTEYTPCLKVYKKLI